jgi:hypothetical protein
VTQKLDRHPSILSGVGAGMGAAVERVEF